MKRILKMAFCLCVASVVTLLGVVGYAYFSKQEIYDGMPGGEVELLFDRLDDATLAKYQTEYLGGAANPEAEWGSEENPYIISNIKHLYNLAELQRLGYFDIHYISKNYDENGNYVTDDATGQGKIMPYFMVCTSDGKPVTIDGNTFDGTIISVNGIFPRTAAIFRTV